MLPPLFKLFSQITPYKVQEQIVLILEHVNGCTHDSLMSYTTLGIPLGGHFRSTFANLFSAARLSVVAIDRSTFLVTAFNGVKLKNRP